MWLPGRSNRGTEPVLTAVTSCRLVGLSPTEVTDGEAGKGIPGRGPNSSPSTSHMEILSLALTLCGSKINRGAGGGQVLREEGRGEVSEESRVWRASGEVAGRPESHVARKTQKGLALAHIEQRWEDSIFKSHCGFSVAKGNEEGCVACVCGS